MCRRTIQRVMHAAQCMARSFDLQGLQDVPDQFPLHHHIRREEWCCEFVERPCPVSLRRPDPGMGQDKTHRPSSLEPIRLVLHLHDPAGLLTIQGSPQLHHGHVGADLAVVQVLDVADAERVEDAHDILDLLVGHHHVRQGDTAPGPDLLFHHARHVVLLGAEVGVDAVVFVEAVVLARRHPRLEPEVTQVVVPVARVNCHPGLRNDLAGLQVLGAQHGDVEGLGVNFERRREVYGIPEMFPERNGPIGVGFVDMVLAHGIDVTITVPGLGTDHGNAADVALAELVEPEQRGGNVGFQPALRHVEASGQDLVNQVERISTLENDPIQGVNGGEGRVSSAVGVDFGEIDRCGNAQDSSPFSDQSS